MKTLILGIAVVAFAGAMVVLPFAGIFQSRQADPSAADPGAQVNGRQEELEAQANGYELVLDREPDNQTALRGLLEVRLELGDIEGTIAPLERLVELNPDQTDYAVLLAQANEQIGDREAAAQVYRDILLSQPGNINALQGLVALLMDQSRPEAAIGLLEDTLNLADDANQVQPGSVDVVSVQLLLGRVYVDIGRDEEALSVYDDAIIQDELDFRPVLAKAIVLQGIGRNDEAQPLFEQAAAMAPAQYRDQINLVAAGESADGATDAVEDTTGIEDADSIDAAESDASSEPDAAE
jgi:tetratricopeptide (TPR) repeat protein